MDIYLVLSAVTFRKISILVTNIDSGVFLCNMYAVVHNINIISINHQLMCASQF